MVRAINNVFAILSLVLSFYFYFPSKLCLVYEIMCAIKQEEKVEEFKNILRKGINNIT